MSSILEEIPYEYLCPISHFIMLNPVKASDNHIYDYKSIKEWLKDHNTSPKTREILDKTNLPHEKELSTEIFEYILKYLKIENPNLDIINKLIFDLENRKDELFYIDIQLSMLKIKRDQIIYNNQNKNHTILEKQFNRLFNDNTLILHKEDIIYMLELEQDHIYDIDLSKTIFNSIPSDIRGSIKCYNMKMSVQCYLDATIKSESDSDEDYIEFEEQFNKREGINSHTYSNKNEVLEILQTYENDSYNLVIKDT